MTEKPFEYTFGAMASLRLDCPSCVVRPWRARDLASLLKHADNPKIAAQLRDRFPHPYTRKDGVAWLRHATTAQPVTNLAIDVDGSSVGGVGFVMGSDVERYSAEIGYWIGEVYWGRGIVTDALRVVTDHAFATHGLHRIFAVPFADNAASRRVLEKAGYTLEGIMRRSAVKAGQVRDQALYAAVR